MEKRDALKIVLRTTLGLCLSFQDPNIGLIANSSEIRFSFFDSQSSSRQSNGEQTIDSEINPRIPRTVPDVIVYDLDGNEHNLRDYFEPGHDFYVAFWTTRCAPCRRELVELDRIQREGRGRVVAISPELGMGYSNIEKLAGEIMRVRREIEASRDSLKPLSIDFLIARRQLMHELGLGENMPEGKTAYLFPQLLIYGSEGDLEEHSRGIVK